MDSPVNNTTRIEPWVELRSPSFQTYVYRRMIARTSESARAGDCVTVYDRAGRVFGAGLYNPKSQIALRMLRYDEPQLDDSFWKVRIQAAVHRRMHTLRIGDISDAMRLVYSEGDGVSGLVVDRFGPVLSAEVFSAGIWRRMDDLLPMLHEAAGTSLHVATMDDRAARQEGILTKPMTSPDLPRSVEIREHGVRYRVDFAVGHKTGFFCDQRDNRRRIADLAAGRSMLDVCSYTGGFGLCAKVCGDAREVTCVELDEEAAALIKRNANLNQVRVDAVQADAFAYMRQMQTNGRNYDVVVLDPPKLVFGRQDRGDGRKKYFDMNRLAASLVASNGVLATCSCSGALPRDEFLNIVVNAVHAANRTAQIIDVTGAAVDHPIAPRCPETAYLKCVWLILD